MTVFKTIIITWIGITLTFSSATYAEALYGPNIKSRLIDEDRDGVIAARDLCPNTPNGSIIDHNGCPSQITKNTSIALNIRFDSGKADLKPHYRSELKELITFLQNNPASTVVIEGHTDNKGSAELNKELSQKRAAAITDVLIDSFRIKPNRVKAIGYGENKPLADNNTVSGREKNRRVVAEIMVQQKQNNERWTIYSVDNSNTALNSAFQPK